MEMQGFYILVTWRHIVTFEVNRNLTWWTRTMAALRLFVARTWILLFILLLSILIICIPPCSSEYHDGLSSNEVLVDENEDSFYDPLQEDPDCRNGDNESDSCWQPPESTIETFEQPIIDASCSYGGDDPDQNEEETAQCTASQADTNIQPVTVDKHWGSDKNILKMRDALRASGAGNSMKVDRPPVFLLPGLASTRLVAWKHKQCAHPLLSDIKVQDNVWLNINLIMQMGTIDVTCMKECMQLGYNQTDTIDLEKGCKLRPDEGLDAISSLSPGGIGSQLLVGGTNTVYAWLIQWLVDNLGYDGGGLVGLPYDWRLSPDKMEQRDGFLTLTRRRIEAAVQTNGKPGIVVAHSMGNLIFRYFLEWLRTEMREEAYEKYTAQATKKANAFKRAGALDEASFLPGWMQGVVNSLDEWLGWTEENKDKDIKHEQLWEISVMEGDNNWYEWVEKHIWTYVGLSAPMLGAVNPLRAVISGENMGLPVQDAEARVMELSFGSTHTVNAISTQRGFCDERTFQEWDEESSPDTHSDLNLACLDDVTTEIETRSLLRDPWIDYPALKALLRVRVDWGSQNPMIEVVEELCKEREKSPCASNTTTSFGPKHSMSGDIFSELNRIWNEVNNPLFVKREQLRESFWDTRVPNILNSTWDRPLIKHVIMAYGVDIPTEVGYTYRKTHRERDTPEKQDNVPRLDAVFWETAGGNLALERTEPGRGGITDYITKKKPKKMPIKSLNYHRSGDGSVPYISLAWAHTWLLHGLRARWHSQGGPSISEANPLDEVSISHRPKGATEWKDGPPPQSSTIVGEKTFEESSDTGTSHPHGTKYKPEMVRYHSEGRSRTTGIEYSTTVIEATGVEHKETTRNYDILAAVFTDVLRKMHDDLNIV